MVNHFKVCQLEIALERAQVCYIMGVKLSLDEFSGDTKIQSLTVMHKSPNKLSEHIKKHII